MGRAQFAISRPAGGLVALAVSGALLAACGGQTSLGGVTILRYGITTGSPTALATGTLQFTSGCAVLETIDPNGAAHGTVILWPMTTSLRLVDGRVFVALGDEAATAGDRVELGGGEQTDQAFVDSLVDGGDRCRSDRYWMAASFKVLAR